MERASSRRHHCHKHAPPPRTGPRGIELRLAALTLALASAGAVQAIGLDEIAQQSSLGEPLRLVIPVLSGAGDLSSEESAGECFKLVAPGAGDFPQLNSARVSLEQRGGRAFVVLTTNYPINEPIMRVAVQAGCRVSVSREYTVLLDPVTIRPPVAERATDTPAAVAAAAAAVAEPAAEPRAAVAAPEARTVPRATPSREHAVIARGATERTINRSARGAVSTAPAARAAKASVQPRLQVSRTVVDAVSAPGPNAAPTSAAEREALRTIEEQTVVLQRQIAELSIAMERMQQELAAARAAKAEAERTARTAAEQAGSAASGPWVAVRAWAGVNWPLLVLIPALLALVAAALHRRRPILVPAPITSAQAAAFNRADLGEESVPGPEALEDKEALVAPLPTKNRAHVIPPVFVDPATASRSPVSEFKYDPGIAFDDDVQQTAEASSAYSALEREQPGIIGRLTDSWGTPRAAVQLENYLLTPRRGGRMLSHGAIEELKLLRSIALDHVGGPDMLIARPREGNGQSRSSRRL